MDGSANEMAALKDILSHQSGVPRFGSLYCMVHDDLIDWLGMTCRTREMTPRRTWYADSNTCVRPSRSGNATITTISCVMTISSTSCHSPIGYQMYMTAQHILTTYTGSFTKFVHDRIFLPLNMSSTTYSYSEAAEGGQTTQNWGENGRLIPWWFKDAETELISGAGGIITSAHDLVHETSRHCGLCSSLTLA